MNFTRLQAPERKRWRAGKLSGIAFLRHLALLLPQDEPFHGERGAYLVILACGAEIRLLRGDD